MEIPQGFPRFEGQRALLIVAGKQVGKIYAAANANLAEIASIDVPPVRYTDRESPFKYRQTDQMAKREFLKKTEEEVKRALQKKTDAVYLFAPDYSMNEIKKLLPREARDRIKISFMGNFTKLTELDLIGKIRYEESKQKDKNRPLTPEEMKILKRPKAGRPKPAKRR